MTRMNIEDLKKQVRLMAIVETLHELGLSWEEAEKFPFVIPFMGSCYKMGEKVIWQFKGNTIFVEDHTEEYAKSCKWRAQHGRVVMNFTSKKQLKDFAHKAISYTLDNEDIDKVVDKKQSILKNNDYSCRSCRVIRSVNYSIQY